MAVKRPELCPIGETSVAFVRARNLMVSRMAIFMGMLVSFCSSVDLEP